MDTSTVNQLRHFLGKAEDAATGGYEAWIVQSTGEKVAVALALNRSDWLAEIGYSIAEAIDRTDDHWIRLVRVVERTLRDKGLI